MSDSDLTMNGLFAAGAMGAIANPCPSTAS